MAGKRISDEKREQIRSYHKEGLSVRQIHRLTGVNRDTISDTIGPNRVQDDITEQRRRETLSEQNIKYKEALSRMRILEQELAAYCTLDQHAKFYEPVQIGYKQNKPGEAVAFANLGDWHIEEVVDSGAVGGLNEYNSNIAEQRVFKIWSTILSLLEMCRSKSRINVLIINLLGDLINGWIHEVFIASNAATPPEAILKVFDMLVSGLDFLCKNTNVEKIIVIAVCGNHGRITQKKFSKLSVETNYEWLIYKLLAKWFTVKNNKIIRFKLPKGSFNFITIYNKFIRVFHGDDIQYQGGIGGIHIPLRKAIDRWNTGKLADYNILGHWHSYMMGEDYLVNGSAIGYSEYSLKIKATYQKPTQSFFIWHPKYGPTAQFPIVLGDKPIIIKE